MKKLCVLAMVLLALSFVCAFSEETISIQPGEMGVIYREMAAYRTRALIQELDMAYLEADSPYLTKGQQVRFTAHVTGGDGKYTYTFSIFRRSGTEGLFYQQATSGNTRSNTFYYTPNIETGQYILSIRVTDSAGSYIQWQSQVYESSECACAEKARSLAEECMKNASGDYARALWLHDWLIHNADYDYSYQYYYPSGVLLYGKGVCQSYALAYEMLLKLVGIDSVYVTGIANGGSHGWNLVKIDGKWYHVDCTWDDPAPGKENHNYFCVPDSVMLKDHTWRHEVQILPDSVDKDYMYAVRSGADTCKTQEDVKRILDAALKNRRNYIEILYIGEQDEFDFRSAFNRWYETAQFVNHFDGCRYTITSMMLKVEFDYGNGYPDLSKPQTMVIDPSDTEFETGETMSLLVLSVPSSANLSGMVWSSSNPSCISVDNRGLIRALNPGVCRITVRHPNGSEADIDLYVNSNREFMLPEFVSVIEEGAFSDCYLFETIIVPRGVTEIDDYAFSGCSLLKTIAIPDTVIRMGENVFAGCNRVVIECTAGSYAQLYAQKEGLAFRIVSNQP